MRLDGDESAIHLETSTILTMWAAQSKRSHRTKGPITVISAHLCDPP
jgi:hypothetical protein